VACRPTFLGVVPTNAAAFSFTVRATDSAAYSATRPSRYAWRHPCRRSPDWFPGGGPKNNTLDSAGTNNGVALNGATYAPAKSGRHFPWMASMMAF